ncbi:MAG: hypothetical protein U5L04_02350 [Trueperaceae bacterium]|nr:hypothetical protein [Trueperaceae bacterium]
MKALTKKALLALAVLAAYTLAGGLFGIVWAKTTDPQTSVVGASVGLVLGVASLVVYYVTERLR